jgi:TRAP-type C4-dicarboxylate transport system permease small subunit
MNKIEKVIGIFSGVLLGALTVVVFGEIVLREAFSAPFAPANELTLIMFPWLSFLAAINITKNDEHISLVFIKDNLPPKLKRVVNIFIRICMLAFSVMMTIGSFTMNITLVDQRMPVLGISKVALYGSVFVSFLGITAVLAYQVIDLILRKDDTRGDRV